MIEVRVIYHYISRVHDAKMIGHIQTNSSKAWQGRAELARYLMLVLFLLDPALLCPAPRYLSGHTNRNNTNIKHRSGSAQPCFTVCLATLIGITLT